MHIFFVYASAMAIQSLQNYDKLIDLIYATPENSELWPDLLQALDDFNDEPNRYDAETSEQLGKHIQRSCDIMDAQQTLQQENELLHAMVNRFPIGVIIVQANAEVVAINQRAEVLLQKNPALSITQGVLKTYNSASNKILTQHLQDQRQNPNEHTGAPMQLKAANNKPVSLWITPTQSKQQQSLVSPSLISIYMTSSELRLTLSTDMLIKLYGLTQSEANLAQHLCNGHHKLLDAAEASDISYESARTYLKSIFHKTNTHSQPEFIKLLLTCPAALVGEHQEAKTFQPDSHDKIEDNAYIRLHDGRTLGYVEYGNPEGEPVIFCHSLIHMDKQMFHIPEMQDALNYRIIAPKRPGFLNSSAKNNYSLQDHANDVLQLIDYLGIQQFKVIGHSNSAGYAATIAHDYPERVHKLLLISPFVPPGMDDLSQLQTNDKLMYACGKYMPQPFFQRVALITMQGMYKNPEALIQKNLKYFSASERQFCASPSLVYFLKQWIQTSYPSRINAVAYDLLVRVRDWGFKPEHIHVPTQLWYAEDDSTIANSAIRQLETSLPQCTSHHVPSGGHYIFFTHFDAMMVDF